uniref:TrpR like protein, YerC/YecD n=1 Tax=candidate division WWE3 bacterium TaxID=2053526 RepID=A0A831YTG5_UNCKA
MRRYRFLQKEEVYEALNRLRDAFLAAKDGTEVERIISGLLTFDEKMKIGRRIQVAEYLNQDYGEEEISNLLRVGKATISAITRKVEEFPDCFELLKMRRKKVENEYQGKGYQRSGGSLRVFKPRVYTGFKRKDVKR